MKTTPKMDARTLTHSELTDLRRRAVGAVQRGEAPKDVASTLDVCEMSVYRWVASFRDGGWHALDAKKRGGRKPKVDAKMMRWVYGIVTLGNPKAHPLFL